MWPTQEWVTSFFHSFNQDLVKGDMDAWMENWSPNARRDTPMGCAVGRAQIRLLYEELLDQYDELEQQIYHQISEENQAAVELLTTGVHRATGKRVEMPNVALLTFDERGLVKCAKVYMDMKQVEAQIQG